MVCTAWVLAWLVALAAGAQTRTALAQLRPANLCTTAAVQDTHALHGLPGGAEEAPPGHAQHHDPDCLLCITLATPSAVALAIGRSPVPVAHQDRRSPALAVPVRHAQAPLPARGPPASIHA